MKKSLIFLSFLVPVTVLVYQYSFISFFLIMIVVLGLTVLLLAGTVKIFKKSLNRRWFEIPFMIIVICCIGIIISLLSPLDPPTIESNDVSKTLAYAYETDQGDRNNLLKFYLFKDKMKMRDSIRLEQVKQLYGKDQIKKPFDKFHAAFVLHHNYNRKSELYEIAHELAKNAASSDELQDEYQVQWLAKATYDRWMLSIGKPQKFDTQGNLGISIE